MSKDMIKKQDWEVFIDSGMLWFANMILHVFGWALAYEVKENKKISVYPIRCKFRGFSEKINSEGYIKVTKFMRENIQDLIRESEN